MAACSHEIYEEILGIGPDDHHDSCTNNLHTSLAVGLREGACWGDGHASVDMK